jgi:hypothetical protein
VVHLRAFHGGNREILENTQYKRYPQGYSEYEKTTVKERREIFIQLTASVMLIYKVVQETSRKAEGLGCS